MGTMTVPTISFNDDREMPQLGLGTYKLNDDECIRVVREAIDLGYRHFDTATLYKNEGALGTALNQAIDAGDVSREDLFITSKVWHSHHGAQKAEQAFQESMEKLKLDYLDLYLIHWPWPQGGLYVETFESIARLQGMGQIASIGVANFYEEVLENLIDKTGITPVLNQVELHPYLQRWRELDAGRAHGISIEAWGPLGQGKSDILEAPEVTEAAEAHGVSPAQAIIRWHLQNGVILFPKSSTPSRIAENFDVFGFELTEAEMAAITSLEEGEDGRGGLHPNDMNDA